MATSAATLPIVITTNCRGSEPGAVRQASKNGACERWLTRGKRSAFSGLPYARNDWIPKTPTKTSCSRRPTWTPIMYFLRVPPAVRIAQPHSAAQLPSPAYALCMTLGAHPAEAAP
eukprot:5984752-Prymnesium_polylepis.2